MILHSEISSDGIQEVLCYSEHIYLIPEEPVVAPEQQIPLEMPHTKTPDLSGVISSSEPLVELNDPIISEPAKKFFYDNAVSLLLNTVSVVAIKLSFSKGPAKILNNGFTEVFSYTMKSLGTDYFKAVVSEKISADVDKLLISNQWAAFSAKEITSILLKTSIQFGLDVSSYIGTTAIEVIKNHIGFENKKEIGAFKWPGCIPEIATKVVVKDYIQEVIGAPYINPITAPYTDLKVGSIVAEASKSVIIGCVFKDGRSDVVGLTYSSIKIAIAKCTTQWVYEKYLEKNVTDFIDSCNEYIGLTNPWWSGFIKAQAGSVFCKLPIHMVQLLLTYTTLKVHTTSAINKLPSYIARFMLA